VVNCIVYKSFVGVKNGVRSINNASWLIGAVNRLIMRFKLFTIQSIWVDCPKGECYDW